MSWRGLKAQFGETWGGLLDTQEAEVVETPGLPRRVLNLQPLLPPWAWPQAGRDKQEAMPGFLSPDWEVGALPRAEGIHVSLGG